MRKKGIYPILRCILMVFCERMFRENLRRINIQFPWEIESLEIEYYNPIRENNPMKRVNWSYISKQAAKKRAVDFYEEANKRPHRVCSVMSYHKQMIKLFTQLSAVFFRSKAGTQPVKDEDKWYS